MKHNLKITLIILAMFVITQFIGLAVIHIDPFTVQQEVNGTLQNTTNPYLEWINPPEPETQQEYGSVFASIIIAFVFAIILLFLLMKFKIEFVLRTWFFVVIAIALFISFFAVEKIVPFVIELKTAVILAAVFGIVFAYLKIFHRNFLIHNFTELLIYPGIASVFVPILNIWTIIFLLIIISIYDMWAVWHSGIMQKMAKYQIDTLNIFSGFFIPYASKKTKAKIKKMKKSELKKKKIKVNLAILGGGDVIFPIIAAGVVLKTSGLIPALLVTLGATLGLSYLFFMAEKKKFYPAMPFITAGIFVGMFVGWAVL